MRYLKIYSLLLILSLSFGACEKLLEPENDNHSTINRIYSDPGFAEGLLMTAYTKIPTNGLSFNDVATDDAVTNNKLNSYLRLATGEWSALFNPVNQWDNCNSAILYLNNFMGIIDTVAWKWSNSEINTMFVRRFKGEAYALRGLFEYHLLQTIGGVGVDNKLLGIPIYNKIMNADDNFNVPRATFDESVSQIYSDLDKALEYLTMDDYKDITSASQLPPGLESVKVTDYNSVFGLQTNQRISGRTVKALKARVALLAASPAFANNDATLWEKAANYAGASITGIGGIAGLDPNGSKFYDQTRVDAINLASNKDQKEIVWRSTISTSSAREKANFPPSLFGNGNVNPTQNLVDAFPMANGYPISHPLSLYNPANPYAGRDYRLALYIVYNGNKMSAKTITTGFGGGTNAKDSIQTSTRTGYYLKKLLREDVNLNPVSPSTKIHYEVHMRFTELFLIYAEAANEAYGPDGTGSNDFSARNVIAAIRKRAGISQPDNYLISITTKEDMRKLIRNERRLELCFEGFRFWDLRRWKADLTETAKGINIDKAKTNFQVVDVEARSFNNQYMHFGPLPEREVVKYDALIQNKGW
ncbi:MAG: RagB/SusD family nutrient uptake outer membrane protein [Bacteroidota bacterium]|nr:RagB/SusD family nutrient uptake outer membrane protein [Bacteroidota bacterium]